MSKEDELLNLEAGKHAHIDSKYSTDHSNAFYAMLSHSSRKRKCSDTKLIRVYSAGKMDCGNWQLGPFNEGNKYSDLIVMKVIISVYNYILLSTTIKQRKC